VVFCTIVEAQIVFKMLFVLVTSQLTITGQLERKVYLQRIWLFLKSGGQRWFGGYLGR